MKTRWFIRSLFLGLLTLCVVAWVGSYFEFAMASHDSMRDFQYVDLHSGLVRYSARTGRRNWGEAAIGWHMGHSAVDAKSRAAVWDAYRGSPYHVAGFAWRSFSEPFVGSGWGVVIPLYFPTILSALLLWLASRKTKEKPRGFPVEMAATKTEGGRP